MVFIIEIERRGSKYLHNDKRGIICIKMSMDIWLIRLD